MSPVDSGKTHRLTGDQADRAAGVLLGAACGDALGVPYEFGLVVRDDQVPAMIGGGLGPYRPGEYSDDTQMAVCIARVTAAGELAAGPGDIAPGRGLDRIADGFLDWFADGATDVGILTRTVLSAAAKSFQPGQAAQSLREAAADAHRDTGGRSAGNGSLMRTGVIALALLADGNEMAAAARAVSELTHYDPLAGDACVLWCSAIRRAVLDGTLDGLRDGIGMLPAERRGQWETWLAEAEAGPPGRFAPNGFVVRALQAAWSAIACTPVPAGPAAAQHFERAVIAAIRIGNDTDTIGAIAGALLGARWGASAVPAVWSDAVNGWPGLRASDLTALAAMTARSGSDPGYSPADPEIAALLAAQSPRRWAELFRLADELGSGAGHVRWESPRTLPDGSTQVGYPVYSAAVDAIHGALAALNVIVRFPWMDWDGTRRYQADPGSLSSAPVADAARLATAVFRSERFSDGSIGHALETGVLTAILARLRHWYVEEHLG